ncbi:MAG: AAA family ATPase, partial [Bacteroidales bacterium]|nr:AAA family ATPase [Bacteroidales bacterium]
MNTMRKLPIGIQDFEYLRTNNFVYVDKTQFVYRLAHYGKPYFLSRPRRFGKSLFLSTLKAYFEGKKEVFEGLKIAELETEWTKYPVFYLDFNIAASNDVESMNAALEYTLSRYEKEWSIEKNTDILSIRFTNVICGAHNKFGQKVVVLVDEYDKPLINTMDNAQVNENLRNILKGFYGVLKGADAHLRFVFLTGVTKFSKVSIFSDLNQLMDISLNKQFAGICGISETELLQNFQPEIQALAEANNLSYDEAFAKLKKFYDGYHFAKESEDIYNPFGLLNTFFKLDFAYYWFATGTPTFLAKALQKQNYDIR